MLVTFKSRAAPDVRMLTDLASYLVGIVGKRLNARGVIASDEVPQAIDALEEAISVQQKLAAEYETSHFAGHDGASDVGSLSQRAFPFLNMLREAEKQHADIIWGL
ncbi:DUF1840 domain-containing protein [Caballeronia sordidicola]|uniref:DUF1840 domain-containing protein n=1 Tax=Caballeronia sordidicola TaxID=196367 RepID=UPI000A38DBC7|nr:DUF1840 domain-containing protein [Caballeronia sordidicola]